MSMSILTPTPPRILVAEHDDSLQDLLHTLLKEEGYQTVLVSSLEAALEQVDKQAFHLILTDPFAETAHHPFDAIRRLLRQSYPTPIGIITGWSVQAAEAIRLGFAFLILKPFDLDTVLLEIAAALAQPFSPEQQSQVQLIKRYFQATEQRDWAALGALVTDDVTLYPAGRVLPPSTRKVSGRSAFLAYISAAHQHYHELGADEIVIYPLPKGLAVLYHAYWLSANGTRQQIVGRLLLHFQGNQIAQIGVRANIERLRVMEEGN